MSQSTSKMKVLHFKTTYLNQSETFIDRLVRNHQEFQPVVATCYKNAYADGLTIYEMPNTGFHGLTNIVRLKLNSSPRFLTEVFEKEKPDIVHGHFGLDSYRLIAMIRKYNVPFIVNFYGHDVIRLPKNFGWTTRYKRLRKYLDAAIAVSEDMRQNLEKLGFDPSKIYTIKLAVDTENIKFQQRTKATPKIMMVGRLVEKKGFTHALNAVNLIKNDLPELEMNVFGDGTLMSDLKTEVKQLGIGSHVNFRGFMKNDEIINQLYKHDILIVPSVQAKDGDREGMPQTTVEGMATGIPVIASDHAGLPELVIHNETGLQVPEKDPAAIGNAIKKLVRRPELVKSLSLKGRLKVEEEHDITKQAKKTEGLYKKMINENKMK